VRGHKEFCVSLDVAWQRSFWGLLPGSARCGPCCSVSNFLSEAARSDPRTKKKPIISLVPPTRQRFMGIGESPSVLIPATGHPVCMSWSSCLLALNSQDDGGSCSQIFLAAVLDGLLQPPELDWQVGRWLEALPVRRKWKSMLQICLCVRRSSSHRSPQPPSLTRLSRFAAHLHASLVY